MMSTGMQLTLRYRWLKVLKGNPTKEQLEKFEAEINNLMRLKEESRFQRKSF